MANYKAFQNIFKTTFLFGSAQVINLSVRVVGNKVVALLLGAEGMGIIGLFSSATTMVQSFCGLGISQSAVRDVSEANKEENAANISEAITMTNRIVVFTSLFGLLTCAVLAPLLSKWAFGSYDCTVSYICLSLMVAMHILTDGKLAILKGMRRMKDLAKASVYGAIGGLAAAVPFYFIWGKQGIVPSLLTSALVTLVLTDIFVRRIDYRRIRIKLTELFRKASLMIGMGISLMAVGFLAVLGEMIISAYISNNGGVAIVGFYQAGSLVITRYFGIIMTAMVTDYYPRISAIHSDNSGLTEELNNQCEIGMLMIAPLAAIFIPLSPLIIRILYSGEFLQVVEYLDYAVAGVVLIFVSNAMGMILLAKRTAKVFLTVSLCYKSIFVVCSLVLFHLWGLKGLGITYFLMAILHMAIMTLVLAFGFKIKLNFRCYLLLLGIVGLLLIELAVKIWLPMVAMLVICGGFFVLTSIYCLLRLKSLTGFKLRKRQKAEIQLSPDEENIP